MEASLPLAVSAVTLAAAQQVAEELQKVKKRLATSYRAGSQRATQPRPFKVDCSGILAKLARKPPALPQAQAAPELRSNDEAVQASSGGLHVPQEEGLTSGDAAAGHARGTLVSWSAQSAALTSNGGPVMDLIDLAEALFEQGQVNSAALQPAKGTPYTPMEGVPELQRMPGTSHTVRMDLRKQLATPGAGLCARSLHAATPIEGVPEMHIAWGPKTAAKAAAAVALPAAERGHDASAAASEAGADEAAAAAAAADDDGAAAAAAVAAAQATMSAALRQAEAALEAAYAVRACDQPSLHRLAGSPSVAAGGGPAEDASLQSDGGQAAAGAVGMSGGGDISTSYSSLGSAYRGFPMYNGGTPAVEKIIKLASQAEQVWAPACICTACERHDGLPHVLLQPTPPGCALLTPAREQVFKSVTLSGF